MINGITRDTVLRCEYLLFLRHTNIRKTFSTFNMDQRLINIWLTITKPSPSQTIVMHIHQRVSKCRIISHISPGSMKFKFEWTRSQSFKIHNVYSHGHSLVTNIACAALNLNGTTLDDFQLARSHLLFWFYNRAIPNQPADRSIQSHVPRRVATRQRSV